MPQYAFNSRSIWKNNKVKVYRKYLKSLCYFFLYNKPLSWSRGNTGFIARDREREVFLDFIKFFPVYKRSKGIVHSRQKIIIFKGGYHGKGKNGRNRNQSEEFSKNLSRHRRGHYHHRFPGHLARGLTQGNHYRFPPAAYRSYP